MHPKTETEIMVTVLNKENAMSQEKAKQAEYGTELKLKKLADRRNVPLHFTARISALYNFCNPAIALKGDNED